MIASPMMGGGKEWRGDPYRDRLSTRSRPRFGASPKDRRTSEAESDPPIKLYDTSRLNPPNSRPSRRLREVVVWIVAWEVRLKEFESVEQRLKQCEAERDHIRELEIGLRPRISHNQDPKSKWVQ